MAVMWSVIFYSGAVIAAFYFLLLRPVLNDRKTQRDAVRALRIGDEIVTTGGLIGEVKDIIQPPDGPTEIILEIAPNIRVRAVTEAISRRLTTLEDAPEPTLPKEASQPSA
jgi:preprotein translocase subunit YajC